jgi:hypothetical protein
MRTQLFLPFRRLAIAFIVLALLGTGTGYLVKTGFWVLIEPFQTLVTEFYTNVSAELLSIVGPSL